jgi:periplasmic protein TonB
MRNSLLVVFAMLLALAASAWTQTQQNDTSSMSTNTAAVADDPAFAEFQTVTRGMKPPKATSAPDPKYPDLPQDAEPRGTVVLLIGVNTKGHVAAVRVLRSDEVVFEKTAVETVKKWKFKPAEKDGHAVPVQVTVEMKFQR